MNLGFYTYYDRTIMKNLAFRTAGFEGTLYQSILRCASGTATSCIDDNIWTAWPAGYWNGAMYEIVYGAAKGRSGFITTSTAPTGTSGPTYNFGDSGVSVGAGDYIILRRYQVGGATVGWITVPTGTATATTERVDLPPGTRGFQALRINAGPAGSGMTATGVFGQNLRRSSMPMVGTYRLSFKAKAIVPGTRMTTSVFRTPNNFLVQNHEVTTSWSDYSFEFTANDNPVIVNDWVAVRFNIRGPGEVILDEVSMIKIDGDPTNTSAFRDEVVAALREYRPAVLRSGVEYFAETLDNLLTPSIARQRTLWSAYRTQQDVVQYSLHEFLELCELIGAEPWFNFPIVFSNAEMASMMEYFAGSTATWGGARRAALGHPTPWTSVFNKIHLEFGNESWNGVYRGGAIHDPVAYGTRGGELFGVAKATPYYDPAKFNFVLGVQVVNAFRGLQTHNSSSNHDSIAIAPYIGYTVNNFSNDEELFGPLFAEPEWWTRPQSPGATTYPGGATRRLIDFIQQSSRPVAISVYETNLATADGSISQEVLNEFTPSLGAGLATGALMLTVQRDFGARDINFFCLYGYQFGRRDGKSALMWGAFRDIGVTGRKRPQFYSAQMINDVSSGSLVQTTHSGDNPTWNQGPMNNIEYYGAHYLQSFAFSDGNRRALVLFNFHRTDALEVNFAGVNAPHGVVTVKLLTSSSPRITNEDAENLSVATSVLTGVDPAANMSLPPYSMTVLSWEQ
jgi:alpha-L-arabinofuranosidase